MTNQFQFNASDVICNGIIGGVRDSITVTNSAKLTTFLNTHFMMVDKKSLLQELEDSDRINMNWEVGSRTQSTQAIIDRMISGLISYGLKKFGTNGGTYKAQREMTEMWVNAQIKMMTAKDIITVMEAAIIDCATADYYYAYEKVWA